jgi:hypothetical protein
LTVETISLDQVREIVAARGYEIVDSDDSRNVLQVRDLDSGLLLTSVLEENVLFNTIQLTRVAPERLSQPLLWRMLAADNGISTSSFQLYESAEGVAITLNNFAKLQAMGEDDVDDILSCLQFLVVDAWAARELLQELI